MQNTTYLVDGPTTLLASQDLPAAGALTTAVEIDTRGQDFVILYLTYVSKDAKGQPRMVWQESQDHTKWFDASVEDAAITKSGIDFENFIGVAVKVFPNANFVLPYRVPVGGAGWLRFQFGEFDPTVVTPGALAVEYALVRGT